MNRNNNENTNDGIHANLRAHPDIFVPRGDRSDVANAETRSSNARLRSNSVFESNRSSGQRSSMLLSQSYGGDDSSSLLLRQGLLPPASQLYRNHSVTVPAMSSITYSGYLYKRSNYPHRNVDEIILDNQQAQYYQQHLPLREDNKVQFPELHVPVMPAMFPSDGVDDSTPGSARSQQIYNISTAAGLVPPVDPASNTEVDESYQKTMSQQQQQSTLSSAFMEEKKAANKNPLQIGLEIGAAFFGLNLNQNTNNGGELTNDRTERQTDDTTITNPRRTSEPIKVASDNIVGMTKTPRLPIPKSNNPSESPSRVNRESSFLESMHRRHSAPITLSESPPSSELLNSASLSPKNPTGSSEIPRDFFDPEDGHLWRAKYCVLEDGVLYFYRNANDGNSVEAAAERKRQSSDTEDNDGNDHDDPYSASYNQSIGLTSNQWITPATIEVDQAGSHPVSVSGIASVISNSRRRGSAQDLSKSPMVRPGRHLIDPSHLVSSDTESRIWEKRVFMDCVGGVRTAEQQYGQNSFELQAMDDDESDVNGIDTLVLKGQNPTEMKEWIFQFHRTLASFMRNFIDVVGSTSTRGAFEDTDHQTSGMLSSSHSSKHLSASSMGGSETIPQSSSEKHLHRLMSTSPSLQYTLSHGHGRTTLKRRMDVRRTPSDCASLSSTPDGGDIDFSHHTFPFREPSPNNNARLSPELVSPPLRHLIPPPAQGYIPPLERGFYFEPTSTSTMAVTASSDSNPHSTEPPTKGVEDSETHTPKVSTAAKYIPPQLRSKTKYIPPHQRRQQEQGSNGDPNSTPPSALQNSTNEDNTQAGLPAHSPVASSERSQLNSVTPPGELYVVGSAQAALFDQLDIINPSTSGFILGGCADPRLVHGSILDSMYIPKRASRLEKTAAEAYGSFGGNHSDDTKENKSSLCWEIGAISECGVRESNEDSYILTNDLLNAFDATSYGITPQTAWKKEGTDHNVGLFGIFDGHCGNQGARFAVEQLGRFIHAELHEANDDANYTNGSTFSPSNMESILHKAIVKMDDRFCNLCQEEGREWESGATALVAMLANENLVIASLGDCRGFICRFVDNVESYKSDNQWEHLDVGSDSQVDDLQQCFWREVTTVHSPSVEQEKARIEKANGWITTETEIPIGQFRRMDFHDEDVIGILKRCMHHPSSNSGTAFTDSERSTKECKAAPQRIIHISRVCGELAVSRALGDRDFKADFNSSSGLEMDTTDGETKQDSISEDSSSWETTLFLPYPDNHSRRFQGDLVTNTPDFHRIQLGTEGVSNEFLLLACDGLWDVMDADDAVRIVRDLLFLKKVTAKKAAARLAELAIHLGSSDNITVILVRLFSRDDIK